MSLRAGETGDLLRGNTPALILAVLADAPCHGYGIAREIERRSRDALHLREGSLYPALRALETDGLVSSQWVPREGGAPRRVYALTEAGRAELARRARSWREFVRAIDNVLGGTADGTQPA
jgi:PadR family transcriptional regulator PadR